MKTTRDTKRKPQGQPRAERRDRRLHQRGQVLAAQPAHGGRRPRRERVVRTLDPTVRRAETEDGMPYTLSDTVGSSGPCRPSWSRRSGPRSRRWPTPTCSCTSSTAATPTRRATSCGPGGPQRFQRGRGQGGHRRQQGRRGRPRGHCRRADPPGTALDRRLGPDRPGHRRPGRPGRAGDPAADLEVKAVIPYERGDLVSRLHQESQVLSTEHREDGTFVHARCTRRCSATSAPISSEAPRRWARTQAAPRAGWQSMRRDAQPVRPADRSERGARATRRVAGRLRPVAALGSLRRRPAVGHRPRGLLRDVDAWASFPFDQAHRREYRWGEDGIAGLCDRYGFLNLAVAMWNGKDDRLKERLSG